MVMEVVARAESDEPLGSRVLKGVDGPVDLFTVVDA
jgi:class 3 adenylate cyclase